MSAALFWFRQDLRLFDNPALRAAAACGKPLYLLYIRDDNAPADERPGGASNWWLHHSLHALARDIARRGNKLILRTGDPEQIVSQFVHEHGVDELHVNQVCEPLARRRDESMLRSLKRCGVAVHQHLGSTLFEPGGILNKAGGPYKVFTPFFNKGCMTRADSISSPRVAPRALARAGRTTTERLTSWRLLPRNPDWAQGFKDQWTPGEKGARAALRRFTMTGAKWYESSRDRPDWTGTSRLSPHLHFGEISPWAVWHGIKQNLPFEDAMPFLRQLGWREFCYHLLWHFPTLATRNFRPEFDRFPWHSDAKKLRAWQRGETGYPIVDAGMRQLWHTGWMHNRVRMITASFLIKDLGVHWREGERWFWDTLVDADVANNAAGWQWVAGCGADAAPYFRVFNPTLQSERFDPEGAYIREWVPELERLQAPDIHAPWRAPPLALAAARVQVGRDYPEPMVDHTASASAALLAYRKLRAD